MDNLVISWVNVWGRRCCCGVVCGWVWVVVLRNTGYWMEGVVSEVVEEMPKGRAGAGGPGRPPKYPWDLWLDGRTHRLVQRVPTGEMVGSGDGVLVPVLTEGDFELGAEQMRKYARKKVERMSGVGLRTRVDSVMVEREVDDGVVHVKVGVLYLRAVHGEAAAGDVGGEVAGDSVEVPVGDGVDLEVPK